MKFGRNVVRRNNKKTTKKSAIKKKINSQIKNPHLKRIPNKDNYKFCTDPTMEDQIRRTNNWIHKTKKSNLDRPSGPVAQRIEALNLYGSRWTLSAGQRFTWSKTWFDRQLWIPSNYWGYGYKTQHSYPRLITWRRPEVKFGWNVVRRNNNKKYQA